MFQNQNIKKRELDIFGLNTLLKGENGANYSKKHVFIGLNRWFEDRKNNNKTIRKRLMIMISKRKSKREAFLNKFGDEFLKLFDGYMLY